MCRTHLSKTRGLPRATQRVEMQVRLASLRRRTLCRCHCPPSSGTTCATSAPSSSQPLPMRNYPSFRRPFSSLASASGNSSTSETNWWPPSWLRPRKTTQQVPVPTQHQMQAPWARTKWVSPLVLVPWVLLTPSFLSQGAPSVWPLIPF